MKKTTIYCVIVLIPLLFCFTKIDGMCAERRPTERAVFKSPMLMTEQQLKELKDCNTSTIVAFVPQVFKLGDGTKLYLMDAETNVTMVDLRTAGKIDPRKLAPQQQSTKPTLVALMGNGNVVHLHKDNCVRAFNGNNERRISVKAASIPIDAIERMFKDVIDPIPSIEQEMEKTLSIPSLDKLIDSND